MNTDFRHIEELLSRFDQVDTSAAIYSSLCWSFAMSAAQTIVRLNRVWDTQDPMYQHYSNERRAETTRVLEQRLAQFGELVSYFAQGGDEAWLPSGALVVGLLQKEIGYHDHLPEQETIEALCAELGATEPEVRAALKHNNERYARETRIQLDLAKQLAGEIERTIDGFLTASHDLPAAISQNDAIRITDKIADKASKYAANRLASALRQTRRRRRDALNADRRLLTDIEDQADQLLTRLQRERDGAFMDAEPGITA
jgi:hypothetical protein